MTDTWELCKFNELYEINSTYPYEMRVKGSNAKILESIDKLGYVYYRLLDGIKRKHIIIALQWIENPNNYKMIDHINRNPGDNHIENLRWVSRSTNNRNRVSN